ncbi:MAG: Na/Pi cotransporter family protein [Actinomycetia bacterium]|nr:Na/Pi cotransporter family protein [Actinomycetes bacterium]
MLIIEVFAGLSLFIFGINRLSGSLQKITSNRLKSIINILAKRSWSTLLVGLFTTVIIQSSSATSVMTVGFVNAGLLTLRQAIGIIMGANIGTTITAQIISFNIDMLSLPIIIIGFSFYFFGRKKRYKNIGMAILGLGLLFLGMTIMKEALAPLKTNEAFKNFLLIFSRNPFLGIIAGIGLTTLLQSSSATIGLLLALASQGLMPIEAAIPILLGDNIGTCSTALISSLRTTITAKRTAFSHLMFNIVGTIVFVILLYGFRLQHFIVGISGSDISRQIANIHTGFNLITTALLFPALGLFERAVTKIFPGKDITINKNALYLDTRLIQTPDIALEQAKKELARVTKVTHEMLNLAHERMYVRKPIIEEKVLDRETAVDSITEDIIRYLTKISQKSLNASLSKKLTSFLHMAYDLERAADHCESILYLFLVKEENNMSFSETAQKELESAFSKTDQMFTTLLEGVDDNQEALRECDEIEEEIDKIVEKVRASHLIRLQEGTCMPLSGVVFADVILHLERIGDLLHGVSRNLKE